MNTALQWFLQASEVLSISNQSMKRKITAAVIGTVLLAGIITVNFIIINRKIGGIYSELAERNDMYRTELDRSFQDMDLIKQTVMLLGRDSNTIRELMNLEPRTYPPGNLKIQETDTEPATSVKLDGTYEGILKDAGTEYEFPDFDENARATTFYTSGTTGNPKGVYFSHRQLVLHTYGLMTGLCAIDSQAVMTSGDVYMPLTPMFHVHAWGMPYLFTMLGNKQVYPGRYEPEMILKLVVGERVTYSHCVPTIIHMLVNSPVVEKIDLSRWKVIIGGSALSKGLCTQAMKHNINIYSAYGMSETCPLLTVAHIKPHMRDWDEDKQIDIRCKTGMPIPMVDLDIFDPLGNPVPHDGVQTGEVVTRAPWLTQGYLHNLEKSEELWEGGWLHTGDVGHIDSEGYLKITDRLKDVIKTGGEWVSSLTLEDIISQHPAVSESAAIGVPDEKWGERPIVLVVLKEEFKGQDLEEELKKVFMDEYDKGIIPKYGVPDKIHFVDEVAKTGVGKLDKKVLRAQYS